ncbi:VOC family protein [Streptomyces sediminimaris]|uniref:VOC family protein n=1 Tax=Streptomyces sediminimaris TaxID=3383721 RepID=UPI00399BA997
MSLGALSVIMRIFRTYARAYADDLDAVLAPLATVTGEPVGSRFAMPNGLELATVGRVLVVAGDERVLEPYRATVATLVIDDLDACRALLERTGARIVRGPQAVPTGRNLTAELPGGVRIEYVEWDEAQWERAGGRPV